MKWKKEVANLFSTNIGHNNLRIDSHWVQKLRHFSWKGKKMSDGETVRYTDKYRVASQL